MNKQPQELLPCPFCGNDKAHQMTNRSGDMYYSVLCGVLDDGCGGRAGYWMTPEQAIAAWNTRTAALCSQKAAVPDGMILLPLEPTNDMLDAVAEYWLPEENLQRFRQTYRSLFNASYKEAVFAYQAVTAAPAADREGNND